MIKTSLKIFSSNNFSLLRLSLFKFFSRFVHFVQILFIIFLRFSNNNLIRKWGHNTLSSSNIMRKHYLHLKSNNTLWETDISDSVINVVVLRLTSRDQVTTFVLHNLSSLLSQLTGDDNLTSLNIFNSQNSSNNVLSSTSNWSLLHQLSLQEFYLSSSGNRFVSDTLKLNSNVSLLETESLLNKSFKFVSSYSIRTKSDDFVNYLNGDDDSLYGVSDRKTRVSGTYKSSSEEFVYFCLEYSICYKFFLFTDSLVHVDL